MIECPTLILWGAGPQGATGDDGRLAVWRRWSRDVSGRGLPCGHFLPEEAPEDVTSELRAFCGVS